jgi:hypothetical protein
VYVREPKYFGWFGTLQRLRDGGVVYEQRDFGESDSRIGCGSKDEKVSILTFFIQICDELRVVGQ